MKFAAKALCAATMVFALNAHAGLSEGIAAHEAKDFKTAFAEFTKDAKNPDAMAWLAVLYQNGDGVARDEVRAAQWMEKAAKGGNAWAQYRFGDYLEMGTGVKKNPVRAFQMRLSAVEHGSKSAIAPLGRSYRYGIGTAIDGAKALQYFTQGAEQGDVDCMQELGYELSVGEIVPTDHAASIPWLQKALDGGSTYRTPFLLGLRYANGEGTEKDLAKAANYYRIAADNGYASAQNNLGVAYKYGYGVGRNVDTALAWFRKAADAGSDKGRENLAGTEKELSTQREEAARREAQAQAEQERARAKRRAPGTLLCSQQSANFKEFQGIYVLGQPYFKDVAGTATVSAYVEGSSAEKVQLRVARLAFMRANGQSSSMPSFDSEWGQLAPGSVFWSYEGPWYPC